MSLSGPYQAYQDLKFSLCPRPWAESTLQCLLGTEGQFGHCPFGRVSLVLKDLGPGPVCAYAADASCSGFGGLPPKKLIGIFQFSGQNWTNLNKI